MLHIAGGLFGASYGVISIRRNLLSDLLMLPPDKSPFATRARTMYVSLMDSVTMTMRGVPAFLLTFAISSLTTKIPENSFVQELNEKFKNSLAATYVCHVIDVLSI